MISNLYDLRCKWLPVLAKTPTNEQIKEFEEDIKYYKKKNTFWNIQMEPIINSQIY